MPTQVLITALLASFFVLQATGIISSYSQLDGKAYTVSYSQRSLLFNGEQVLITSGDIHYTRTTPSMWQNLFQKAKAMGLNTVQVYVFWNIHEQQQGVYDFTGQLDLVNFIQSAATANLFVNLRIGPYIDSEWKFGGLPVWLRNVPNVRTRTSNDAWKAAMGQWVSYVVNLTRPMFAPNGGPVYILQIENEFSQSFGDAAYIQWCGDLAASLNAGIPWEMCNGQFANNTLETCNACDCSTWIAGHWQVQPDVPAMQTESAGWFEMWGVTPAFRSAQAWANAEARFFAYGGSAHNNYMFHGGNNYGGWGGASLTTEYEFDVPLYSNGTTHEPKYSQLGRLNRILHKNAAALLSEFPNPQPLLVWNGSRFVPDDTNNLTSIAYGNIAFLVSTYSTAALVQLHQQNFTLLPLSTVLSTPDELWNSSDVEIPYPQKLRYPSLVPFGDWSVWNDVAERSALEPVFTYSSPIEQITVTNDTSDFLYYSTTVEVPSTGTYNLTLHTFYSSGFVIFVDNEYITEVNDHRDNFGPTVLSTSLALEKGEHELTLLSVSLGIAHVIYFNTTPFEVASKGIGGAVTLGMLNLTNNKWIHRPKLAGEILRVQTPQGSKQVAWKPCNVTAVTAAGSWLQTEFVVDAETLANRTLMLNVTGMSRGYAYVNGFNIGRYWTIPSVMSAPRTCNNLIFPSETSLAPVQSEYHIPPDAIISTGPNTLTLFDEMGGVPGSVYLVLYDDPLYTVQ